MADCFKLEAGPVIVCIFVQKNVKDGLRYLLVRLKFAGFRLNSDKSCLKGKVTSNFNLIHIHDR